jgi:hypothetical protein
MSHYAIYGIYEQEGSSPVYVGMTGIPLSKRFKAHVSSGVVAHAKGSAKTERAKLKALWMHRHHNGEAALVIRQIEVVNGRRQAALRERILIGRYRPILNSVLIPGPGKEYCEMSEGGRIDIRPGDGGKLSAALHKLADKDGRKYTDYVIRILKAHVEKSK